MKLCKECKPIVCSAVEELKKEIDKEARTYNLNDDKVIAITQKLYDMIDSVFEVENEINKR